ncbi:MAG: UDP-galactopyranose mutase [Alphaproteobacteria bacterium]
MSEIVIVGAGYSGAVAAEQLASAGRKVRIFEKRGHIAGNAYDAVDENGILVHHYGPHIFHTNSDAVFDYLSRFTGWIEYEHRVLAQAKGVLLPIPINLETINGFFGTDFDEEEAARHLEALRETIDQVRTSEDVVVSTVGRELYNAFFKGYTRKHWGLDPSQLDASVTARIPYRTDREDRYFTDKYQAMPADGYTAMFERILDHPNISIELETDYFVERDRLKAAHTIYTGPVDTYFNSCFGRLAYRSLRFEHEHLPDIDSFQPVATVNYPNDHDFTRITEFKKLTGQHIRGTSIVREYPVDHGDPYYPVPRPQTQALYRQYRDLVNAEPDVTFVGRLAQYRYYNMDQATAAALKAARTLISNDV